MSMLPIYIKGWHDSVLASIGLTESLSDAELQAPTDCPGWSVFDIVAHLAHLEYVLAHGEPPIEGSTIVASDYTESGVDARRGQPFAVVLNELRDAVGIRAEALEELPDPDGSPPRTPGGVPWNWETLLRNRSIDAWVHEQDIRHAIDQPGGLDSVGANITTQTFLHGMGYVLGKRLAAPAGTVARWVVTGPVEATKTFTVGDDGKARPSDAEPAVTITSNTDDFARRAGGRRDAKDLNIEVSGDENLGYQIVEAMAVTF